MNVATRPLGEIVEFRGGGTPSKSRPEFYEEGSIPWVTPKDMKSWLLDSSIDQITGEAVDQSTAKLIPAFSVLVVIRSGVLKHTLPVGIAQVPVTVNQDLKALVCSEAIDPFYLGRFLRASAQSLLTNVRGTTADNISTSILKDLAVPLPPLPEQKRIAGILDAADALRAKRRESLDQLDTLLQSTFLDMFGDPVTNPMGWHRRTVGDALEDGLLVEVKDGNHGEQHPKVADFSDEGVPFIMSNCMHDGELDLTKAYKLPEEWLGRLRTGFSRGGDALLSHKGTIGEVAIVPDEIEIVILSPQVTYYRTSESLLARYLVGMFGAEGFRRLLEKEAKQSTRAYIGITRQKKLPIVIPPIDLQHRFAAIVESVEQHKASQRAHLAELDTLFASLQSRAFRGEL